MSRCGPTHRKGKTGSGIPRAELDRLVEEATVDIAETTMPAHFSGAIVSLAFISFGWPRCAAISLRDGESGCRSAARQPEVGGRQEVSRRPAQ